MTTELELDGTENFFYDGTEPEGEGFNDHGEDEPDPEIITEDPALDDAPDTKEQLNETEIINKILKSKGIDPEGVQFLNDAGEIEKISFKDLTDEEKINILSGKQEQESKQNLNKDEEELIGYLRKNKLTLDDFFSLYKEEILKDAPQERKYSVDELSDDELFLKNLRTIYPDLTEEEQLEELEAQKVNSELFLKKIKAIRDSAKSSEEAAETEKIKAKELADAKDLEDFQNDVLGSASKITEIGVLGLDKEDAQAAIDVIFVQDKEGNTKLSDALNNPDTLFKIAWFIAKGEESINFIADYYKKEIAKSRKAVADASKANEAGGVKVVKTTNKNRSQSGTSIDDLNIWD